MEQCGLVAIFHHTESFVLFAYTLAAWKVNDGLLGNDQSSFCEFLFLQLCYWSFIIVICLLTESMLIFFFNSQKCNWELFQTCSKFVSFPRSSHHLSVTQRKMQLYGFKIGHPILRGQMINEHISLIIVRVIGTSPIILQIQLLFNTFELIEIPDNKRNVKEKV